MRLHPALNMLSTWTIQHDEHCWAFPSLRVLKPVFSTHADSQSAMQKAAEESNLERLQFRCSAFERVSSMLTVSYEYTYAAGAP